jgi:hypothetical protein
MDPKEQHEVQIVIAAHKGFAVRKVKKGYLAFKIDGGGRTLPTCATPEEAVTSVDQYLEEERQRVEQERQEQEAREQRWREEAERQRFKTETVLACIRPIRDFVAVHGVTTLKDCVEQLDQEERERNVPANWEELAELCAIIGEKRSQNDETQVGEVEVNEYGVTEFTHWNSREDRHMDSNSYGLQEYIVDFYEYLGNAGDLVEQFCNENNREKIASDSWWKSHYPFDFSEGSADREAFKQWYKATYQDCGADLVKHEYDGDWNGFFIEADWSE